ncbi:MAG: hypothetical protein JNL89_01930 [Rhodanobacteraceae bacterium]|nr:hypothetical protein [Rhodanobacteraceae bacterium]
MTGEDAMDGMQASERPALWRVVFATMAAPGEILRRHAGALPAPWALGVSGTAFALFFAQTGIDLHRGQPWDAAALAALGVLASGGALLGVIGVALLAVAAWLLTRPFGSEAGLAWTLRAFALAFSPTLVYGVCGLAAQLLLGWPAALAFGVTGYLWALGPLHAAISELSGGRAVVDAILTTALGGLLLLAWAALGLGSQPW